MKCYISTNFHVAYEQNGEIKDKTTTKPCHPWLKVFNSLNEYRSWIELYKIEHRPTIEHGKNGVELWFEDVTVFDEHSNRTDLFNTLTGFAGEEFIKQVELSKARA